MIYVRYGDTWPSSEYTVLSIGGAEARAIEAVGQRYGITFVPSHGALGAIEEGGEVDYLDAGQWTMRQMQFFLRDLKTDHHAIIERTRYNSRAGSPSLSIVAPLLSETRPWMNAVAADVFAGLRAQYLDTNMADGTIENAHELLEIALSWSEKAVEDVLLLLIAGVRRPIWLSISQYLGPFGCSAPEEHRFIHHASNVARAGVRGQTDEAIERWLALARQFVVRQWTRELPAFSLAPQPDLVRATWLVEPVHQRVLEYLEASADMSLDELRDLIAQEAPEDYKLLRVLSTNSAFKVVYLARDPRGREVVLKRYKWGSEEMEQLAARLATSSDRMIEKDTLTDWMGTVRHPHIQPCMLIRNARGTPFILEPRLERTLDHLQSPPDSAELARMLRGVFEAVAYLHEHGVVHSDIKPDNIGVRGGEAILLDFGIATVETTVKKSNPGSIKTRAPELFGSGVVPTPASDVWALGATVMAVASGGDYPLLRREELRDLPPAADPRRRVIEQKILRRIEVFRSQPDLLADEITYALASQSDTIRRLVIRSCRIDPHDRPPCHELAALLNSFVASASGQ